MRLRLAAFALAAAALAAPAFADNRGAIDCAKAKTADEKAICGSIELVQLDAEMSTELDLLRGLVGMGVRGNLMEAQKDWLAKRHTCAADAACLRKAYDRRIAELDKEFARITSSGPF